MILVMEVIGQHAGCFGLDGRKVFKGCGGTIGRHHGNDWVLTDQHISRHHADIAYREGTFLITDCSANGIGFNAREGRLPPGEPCELKTGDRIYIDVYEILVTLLDADGLGSAPA